LKKKSPVDFASKGLTDYQTLCQVESKRNGINLQENQIGFSFVFSRLVAPVKKNEKVVFTIAARVQVSYSNDTKKRFILASSGENPQTYEVKNDVQDDGNGPESSLPETAFTEGTTVPSPTVLPTKTLSETANSFILCVSMILTLIFVFM